MVCLCRYRESRIKFYLVSDMRHTLITIFAFLSVGLTAQSVKKHALKANLLSPVFNTLNLSYENAVSASSSIAIGASYMDFNDFGNTYYDYSKPNQVKGMSLTAEYRIYYEDQALNGPYLAPFARYMYYERDLQYSYSYSNYDPVYGYIYGASEVRERGFYHSAGIGVVAGYQFVVKNVFSIDMFAGPAYQMLIKKERSLINLPNNSGQKLKDEYLSENIPNRYLSGYGLRAGITLGMLF